MRSGYAPKIFWLNIDIIIDLSMTISEFFEQSVILRPIVANFVWLHALYFFVRLFLPSLGLVLSLSRPVARSPSLLVDTVPCSYRGLE